MEEEDEEEQPLLGLDWHCERCGEGRGFWG
jgi:hypothetical protein